MKARASSVVRAAPPARQVAGFIAKFDPAIARIVRGARTLLRKRYPAACELVYDNFNALAIGWGPNERTSEAFVSLAVYPRGICLYFIHGKSLPDPRGVLEGGGKQGAFVRLTDAALLDRPDIVALLRAAERRGKTRMPATGKGRILIKAVAARQRPRRPEPAAAGRRRR